MLKINGLVERVQRDCHVTIVGPTVLAAFLNSLQMGFKTLAIEQKSAEVWRLLGEVKAVFGKRWQHGKTHRLGQVSYFRYAYSYQRDGAQTQRCRIRVCARSRRARFGSGARRRERLK